jgi:Flp pilus assembly protein TadG
MTMSRLADFRHDERGAAAVEMALIVPLLITLMFGSFELGNYFWSEHQVVKGVRDGARFAGRQSFTKITCSTVDAAVETQIKNLTRTGAITGGTAKIRNWTDSNVTVTVSCPATPLTTGIYNSLANAPRVTVTAAVTYPSLFQRLGFNSSSLSLNASSQAAVMGI